MATGKNSLSTTPSTPVPALAPPPPSYPALPIHCVPLKEEFIQSFLNTPFSSLKETQLLLDFTRLAIQGGFHELLCLNTLQGVEQYWYQIETVRKVLRHFHGRVLLCDEVGLGKTIEAGMLLTFLKL